MSYTILGIELRDHPDSAEMKTFILRLYLDPLYRQSVVVSGEIPLVEGESAVATRQRVEEESRHQVAILLQQFSRRYDLVPAADTAANLGGGGTDEAADSGQVFGSLTRLGTSSFVA